MSDLVQGALICDGEEEEGQNVFLWLWILLYPLDALLGGPLTQLRPLIKSELV